MDGKKPLISVIIPVRNALPYLDEAVASVLKQPEVAEIILVEDFSVDESLHQCTKLFREHTNIKIIRSGAQGPNGPAASRNAGIRAAKSPFLAFLDADDWYVAGRFAAALPLLMAHSDCDAVYANVEAFGSEPGWKAKHLTRTGSLVTGLHKAVAPEALFRTLAMGKAGHLHVNGLLLRRSSLTEDLFFREQFMLGEDSDWFLRLALNRRLIPLPDARPVAFRRVHANNSVYHVERYRHYRQAVLDDWIDHAFHGSRDRLANLYLVLQKWMDHPAYRATQKRPLMRKAVLSVLLMAHVLRHPRTLRALLWPDMQASSIKPVRRPSSTLDRQAP